jgi:hypothetical protein
MITIRALRWFVQHNFDLVNRRKARGPERFSFR